MLIIYANRSYFTILGAAICSMHMYAWKVIRCDVLAFFLSPGHVNLVQFAARFGGRNSRHTSYTAEKWMQIVAPLLSNVELALQYFPEEPHELATTHAQTSDMSHQTIIHSTSYPSRVSFFFLSLSFSWAHTSVHTVALIPPTAQERKTTGLCQCGSLAWPCWALTLLLHQMF